MSIRAAFLGLGLLASALAATIVLELDAIGPPVADAAGIVPIRHVPKAQPRVASEDPEDHTDAWLRTALARPLFSRNRKPTPADIKAGGTTLAALPRLTGIVVGPFGRTAIFAGTDGRKPITVSEGNTVGPYTVQSIEPGGITVAGPQGVQQVSLTADAGARHAMAAEMPQVPPEPQMPGQVPRNFNPAGPPVPPPGTVSGLPLGLQQRQNLLNLRNSLQLRGIPGPQNANPNSEGSD